MITAHVMQKEGLEPSWYHYHTANSAISANKCILQHLSVNVNIIFQII